MNLTLNQIATYGSLLFFLLFLPASFLWTRKTYRKQYGCGDLGLEIGKSRQSSTPKNMRDWYFSGWIDGLGRTGKFNPAKPNQEMDEWFSEIQICCYVLAGDTSLNIDGMADLNILVSDAPIPRNFKCEFKKTEEGGVAVHHSANRQYTRQIHIANTPDEFFETINEALTTGRRIKIGGHPRLVQFENAKLQKYGHFRGWDDRNTCPLVDLTAVELLN